MAETPKDIKGQIIVTGRLIAKPGKADAVAQLLADLKAHANSDAEPGTLQYEIVRLGDEFAVWEKLVQSLNSCSHSLASRYFPLLSHHRFISLTLFQVYRLLTSALSDFRYTDIAALGLHAKGKLIQQLQQSGWVEPKDKGIFFPTDSLPPPKL